jgi:hypothetical protein
MRTARKATFSFVSVLLAASFHSAVADVPDPCGSDFELHATAVPTPLLVCPLGDTPSFLEQGWWISIVVQHADGRPFPNIPASDFWLIDCDPLRDAVLCAGSAPPGADSTTNAAGMTTMSAGTLSAGGCASGMALAVMGLILQDRNNGCSIKCVPIRLRSPDLNGDLVVDLTDISLFSRGYPPNAYDACCDMDLNGSVDLRDLSAIAGHLGAPGHRC